MGGGGNGKGPPDCGDDFVLGLVPVALFGEMWVVGLLFLGGEEDEAANLA